MHPYILSRPQSSSSLSSPSMSSISICSQPALPAPEPSPRVYWRPNVALRGFQVTGMPATRARNPSPMHDERARNTSQKKNGTKKSKLRSINTFILATWCWWYEAGARSHVGTSSLGMQQQFTDNPWKSTSRRQQQQHCSLLLGNSARMNRLLQTPLSALLLLSCVYKVSAHGGEGSQIVVAPDADWPTRHMAGMYIPFTASRM
jgi:hypothetical protein